MVRFLPRSKRRVRPASLSFSPLHIVVLRLVCWAPTAIFVTWFAKVAGGSLGALWRDLRYATFAEVMTPKAASVSAFILMLTLLGRFLSWSAGRIFSDWQEGVKRRRAAACAIDFGPGLKTRLRLEP